MVWSIPVLSLMITMVLIGIHANLVLRKRVIPIVFGKAGDSKASMAR